jgi:hypothetical protein
VKLYIRRQLYRIPNTKRRIPAIRQRIHVLETPLSMHNLHRRLSSLEARGNLSMLLLTLVTTTGRLSLAGGGTATSSDALVVGFGDIAEGAKNRCVSDLRGEELAEEVRRR